MSKMHEAPLQSTQDADLARRVGAHMLGADTVGRALAIELVSIEAGGATVRMRVRGDMLNAYGTCHGGVLATLADSAFAYAANSYNQLTVAAGFSIDLIAPAQEGDVLQATCVVVERGRRNGFYDASVTNQRGERIAMFRGRSHVMKDRPAVADALEPQP
ncbi:hydroxyphenylacetyl-CoA thioesterase PaaI [soil metagenome]